MAVAKLPALTFFSMFVSLVIDGHTKSHIDCLYSDFNGQYASLKDLLAEGKLLLTGQAKSLSNTIKWNMCGDQEAGKTQLICSITGTLYQAHSNSLMNRTIGMEISQAEVYGGTIVFADFAGQRDYQVHQYLFMYPERALFVVLVDVSKPLNTESVLRRWLRLLRTICACRPCVMLIATHVDQCADLDPVQLAVHF